MRLLLLAALSAPAIVSAQPAVPAASLQKQVEARLAKAGPGVRFGMVVTTLDGREIIAINPDGRFVPASNTKLFTTIAAYELLPGLDRPDAAGGARVLIQPASGGRSTIILEGHGDARLSSHPDCRSNCLAALADAVASRTRKVDAVLGDATAFADERWSFGMSWNNIPTRSGTGLGALVVDDNEAAIRVTAATAGEPPAVDGSDYVELRNDAVTVADGATELRVTRMPGERRGVLSGTVKAGSEPVWLRLGVDDPAHYAAWQLKRLLRMRGVEVPPNSASEYCLTPGETCPPRSRPAASEVARLTPPPLGQDLITINKVSQNLHAELLLRRIGAARGKASVAGGLEGVADMLGRAGVPARAADLADGSGMSPYNRASPRGVATMLRWAHGRPWGPQLRASLPIGGVDGTLARRFREGPLKGRIFAKTGSLNATTALSGFMLARSGEPLILSVFANDVPEDVRASAIIDEALELIAASR